MTIRSFELNAIAKCYEDTNNHDADDKPLVYIIILNWNGKGHLKDCLPSVVKTIYPNFKIVVVDNGSTDGSQKFIKKYFPDVELLENEKNLGFVRGNNVGIKYAIVQGAKYIALLNNDTEIDKDWLKSLVDCINKDENIAATTSKMMMYYSRKVINSAGGGMSLLGYGYDLGLYEIDTGQYEVEKEVFFPCAGAMLFRTSIINDVGLMDERYFIYSDDVDWGWRMWIYGYKVKYVPTAIIFHKYGATMGSGSVKKFYLGERNSMCSMLKNYELKTLFELSPLILKHYVFLFGYHCLRLNSEDRNLRAYAIVKGILWNIVNLPRTIKKRLIIQKNRKKSDLEISKYIEQKMFPPVITPDYNVVDEKSLNKNKLKNYLDLEPKSYQLGYGWYNLETLDDGCSFRWIKKEAVFFIKKQREKYLELNIFAPILNIKHDLNVSIKINKNLIYEFQLSTNEIKKIKVDLNDLKEISFLDVLIHINPTWKPKEIFMNEDPRELGVGVLNARVS